MTISRRSLIRSGVCLMAVVAPFPGIVAWAADTYEYDPQGQLRKVTYSNGTVVHYTYDASGNRTWQVSAPAGTTYAASVDTTVWQGEEDLPGIPAALAPVVATPIGGTPEYTFLWQRVSGSTLIAVDNLAGSSTGWQLTGSPHQGAEYTAQWRCRVTDKNSNIAYTPSVLVSLTRNY